MMKVFKEKRYSEIIKEKIFVRWSEAIKGLNAEQVAALKAKRQALAKELAGYRREANQTLDKDLQKATQRYQGATQATTNYRNSVRSTITEADINHNMEAMKKYKSEMSPTGYEVGNEFNAYDQGRVDNMFAGKKKDIFKKRNSDYTYDIGDIKKQEEKFRNNLTRAGTTNPASDAAAAVKDMEQHADQVIGQTKQSMWEANKKSILGTAAVAGVGGLGIGGYQVMKNRRSDNNGGIQG